MTEVDYHSKRDDLISALHQAHRRLQQQFLQHQECLLEGHDVFARNTWLAFCHDLNSHMQFEEQYLWPETNGNGRWSTNVYLAEHRKISSMRHAVCRQLNTWLGSSGQSKRHALLALLDAQQTMMRVMSHHETREEQDLFPVIKTIMHSRAVEVSVHAYLQIEQQYQRYFARQYQAIACWLTQA